MQYITSVERIGLQQGIQQGQQQGQAELWCCGCWRGVSMPYPRLWQNGCGPRTARRCLSCWTLPWSPLPWTRWLSRWRLSSAQHGADPLPVAGQPQRLRLHLAGRGGPGCGTTYYYWLEDVDLSGALTMHGPVSVDFSVPTAVTLSGVSASPAAAGSLPWLWIVAGAGAALGASRLRR